MYIHVFFLLVKSTGSGSKLVKLTLDNVHPKRRLKVNFKSDKTRQCSQIWSQAVDITERLLTITSSDLLFLAGQ